MTEQGEIGWEWLINPFALGGSLRRFGGMPANEEGRIDPGRLELEDLLRRLRAAESPE
jgi:hypothetical protein